MKTVRRDKLFRLLVAGKLAVVDSYHFDDMYGASRTTGEGMPAALNPNDWHDRKEGTCYLHASDFTGYGRAWENPNGTVTLIVHSNCNYTFKILK